MDTVEECEPLTCSSVLENGGSNCADDRPHINGNGHYDDMVDDDGDGAGYTNYKQPSRFRKGKYSGYATLGRVSLHDSWEFDASNDAGEDDDDHRGGYADDRDEDYDEDDGGGEFVSFWRHNYKDDGSSCSSGSSEQQTLPQHLDNTHEESGDDDDDDRVETTMRPIPLLYRKYQGGLGQNAMHDPSSNNMGSWFQKELGVANMHFNERGANHRRRNGLWGLGRRRSSDDGFDDGDANSLLESSSSDEIGDCIPAQLSPLAFDCAMREEPSAIKPRRDNNIFGGNDRRRGGLLALPIVRPFLRGTHRGFTDGTAAESANGIDDDDGSIDGECDMPSRQDREAVVQSISRGISGINDDSLLLDPTGRGDANNQSADKPPPNLLERIFLTRFLQSPGGGQPNQASIIQLHNLLRKEDWSLATELLQSEPELAQTWHNVTRLYGGKYDGEALPIHAACALRPPPSVIKVLCELYPEGLEKKDKAFGRVPLHVACRSLAESSVIKVLCEMNPNCVEERDNLKRVPLHYLIKNYCTFGANSDDSSVDEELAAVDAIDTDDRDGMRAMKILIDTNPGCVHAADHRGWLPIHVACSVSSRKGMIRVMKLLLKVWPESINAKTEKGSGALDCVDLAGKHHPTKDKVLSLLKDAMSQLDDDGSQSQVDELESGDGASVGDGDGIDEDNDCDSSGPSCEDLLDLDADTRSAEPRDLFIPYKQNDQAQITSSSSKETHPITPCPEEDETLIALES